MDVEEYRRRFAAEVEAAERARPVPEGAMETPDPVFTFADPNTDLTSRREAVAAVRRDAVSRPQTVSALLALLQDPAADRQLRLDALDTLQENSFRVVDFGPYRADYLSALRTVATDPDRVLREQAIETLALEKDAYVQRLLLDGLRDRDAELVPPRRALQLIGYDLHAEHYQVIRDIAATSDDRGMRNGALRLLAGDARSTDLFMTILRNKEEDPEARTLSAVALSSLAPREFGRAAENIVLDDTDDDDVRTALLSGLTHGSAEGVGTGLGRRVLSGPGTSRQLARAAEQYERMKEPGDG